MSEESIVLLWLFGLFGGLGAITYIMYYLCEKSNERTISVLVDCLKHLKEEANQQTDKDNG